MQEHSVPLLDYMKRELKLNYFLKNYVKMVIGIYVLMTKKDLVGVTENIFQFKLYFNLN